MGTFPIVKRKGEAKHGTYRTKETILHNYDALARSIALHLGSTSQKVSNSQKNGPASRQSSEVA
jgi:hypothetical protein